jgi:adenylate cyclase
VLNEVFDTIGALVEAHDGEILKFIGDAMLVIFPITPARPREDVAASMVALAEEGLSAIDGLSRENQPLRLGFGGHIGQVELGNIGTMSRLDFTVIGSAVNLASRLEGLCGVLGEPAVFSAAVAEVVGLRTLGAHRLKGVAEPMEAFGLPQPRARA